ncbi:multicopper oxidase domain-containing protein [Streptomyces zaomyceticus]|uniref:Multicopper oxidase domain-containing protein n=1 Tax=Streptomyces zaomyceticus TaxID=68286 RepID=A0ABZ1LKG4_9ACTN
MHLPPSVDGGPHQMIEPGTTWSPSWTVHQQAATLWSPPSPWPHRAAPFTGVWSACS